MESYPQLIYATNAKSHPIIMPKLIHEALKNEKIGNKHR